MKHLLFNSSDFHKCILGNKFLEEKKAQLHKINKQFTASKWTKCATLQMCNLIEIDWLARFMHYRKASLEVCHNGK